MERLAGRDWQRDMERQRLAGTYGEAETWTERERRQGRDGKGEIGKGIWGERDREGESMKGQKRSKTRQKG